MYMSLHVFSNVTAVSVYPVLRARTCVALSNMWGFPKIGDPNIVP